MFLPSSPVAQVSRGALHFLECASANKFILGCAKTTAALIASVDLIIKYKIRQMDIHTDRQTIYEVCAPIVVMIVPTHDLAESAYADIVTFLDKSDAGLHHFVKPLVVHGSIPRPDQLAMIQRNKDANIVIATPGRLADMAAHNFIGSQNTQLLVVDQAFTMAGGSFFNDMEYIKSWLKGPPAAEGQAIRKHYTVTSTSGKGPHVGTEVVARPAPEGFLGELVPPRPRRTIPCIVLAQVLDMTSKRDSALVKHYQTNIVMTDASMVLRFQHNALHHFNGSIEVIEVWRNVQSRSEQLIRDVIEMGGSERHKVLGVSFDRTRVQEYDGAVRKANGQCEMLISKDPARLWSRDAFTASDLPLLITTTLGAEGNNWRELDNLIVIDAPSEKLIAYEGEGTIVNSFKSAFHYYVEAVGRVGRLGRTGRVKIYYDPRTESYAAEDLVKLLKMTNTPIPDFVESGYVDLDNLYGQSDGPQDVPQDTLQNGAVMGPGTWGAPIPTTWDGTAAPVAAEAVPLHNTEESEELNTTDTVLPPIIEEPEEPNTSKLAPIPLNEQLSTTHNVPLVTQQPKELRVVPRPLNEGLDELNVADNGPISSQKSQEHSAFGARFGTGPPSQSRLLQNSDRSAIGSLASEPLEKPVVGDHLKTNPGGVKLDRRGGNYRTEDLHLMVTRSRKAREVSVAELEEIVNIRLQSQRE